MKEIGAQDTPLPGSGCGSSRAAAMRLKISRHPHWMPGQGMR